MSKPEGRTGNRRSVRLRRTGIYRVLDLDGIGANSNVREDEVKRVSTCRIQDEIRGQAEVAASA